MVFDYMEHDLGGLLNRGVEFSVPEIKCLSKQLLEGTNYMHTNKVMHRDMKGTFHFMFLLLPSLPYIFLSSSNILVANLLLNRHGILKIADFGWYIVLSRSAFFYFAFDVIFSSVFFLILQVLLVD